jgi:predicted dehydrogenase
MSDSKPFRIGFVDYQLENYHANVYLKAFRGPLKDRGVVVNGCYGLDAAIGQAWAKKNDVPYFDDATAMNEVVDAYMVLAPSNPETHLELCQRVFMFGKPTYVDKTFAPDLGAAKRIFELADKHHVPVQTSSALRYTNVQAYVRDPQHGALKHMIAWGGGSSFDEYAIHPVEMVISCLGAEAVSLMRRGSVDYSQLLINFSNDRTAVVNVYTKPGNDFAAGVTTEKGTAHLIVEGSSLFTDSAAAILDFVQKGKPTIDRNESLMIRRILDVAAIPDALNGFVKL